MNNKEVAIKKYSAIAKANKTMFLFVAGAAAIAGVAIVGVSFLTQDIAFNAKVIDKQSKSLSAIENSKYNITELSNKVKGLQTNESLISVGKNQEGNALRIILDALPSEANSDAIGSSLTREILNVSGVTIEGITVPPIVESENTSSSNNVDTSSPVESEQASPDKISEDVKSAEFTFTVTASSEQSGRSAHNIMMELLGKMEKSIRTFNITNFKVEIPSNDKITLNITGLAYYLPRKDLQLKPVTVKSDEANAKSSNSNPVNSSANASSNGGVK